VAFDRKRPSILAHKPRRPFFSAPLEGDDHRPRIAKDPMDTGQGFKPREPVQVPQLSSCSHAFIVTGFPRKEKKIIAGNNQAKVDSTAKIYPLDFTKSLNSFGVSCHRL
jgi:hypothetical protein